MATSITLDPQTEERLDILLAQTGQTKDVFLHKMIEQGLEDLEDYHRASEVLARVRNGTEKIYSAEEVRRDLGLDD